FGLDRKTAPEKPAPKPAVVRLVSKTEATPADRSRQNQKLRSHRELIDRIDLSTVGRMNPESANTELRAAIAQLIDEQTVPLSQRDREQLNQEILHEVHGLGPIEPLMNDPEVCDI